MAIWHYYVSLVLFDIHVCSGSLGSSHLPTMHGTSYSCSKELVAILKMVCNSLFSC